MSTENLVVWQKWVDPFGFDDDEEDLSSFMNNDQTDTDETEYNPSPTLPDQELIQNMKASTIKVMATPMGIIPINDNTASGKIFNFWIGHTNFNITKKIAGVIETINGVETLDIFTRYRFRIAVGKAFNDSEVMRDINNTIYKELNNNV
jgi:hypothetical protein